MNLCFLNIRFLILSAILLLTVTGCASKPESKTEESWKMPMEEFQFHEPPPPQIQAAVTQQEDQYQHIRPKFKSLHPLDTEQVSISVVEESYEQILQVLAQTAALNLIISPQTSALLGNSVNLTAEFQNMSVRQILDAVCKMLNVSWYEESGSIFIEPFVRKNIDLDFLGSIRQSQFEVGGDVLGTTDNQTGSIGSPLKGGFTVKGETGNTVNDIYTNIEDSIKQMLNGSGTYVLNRQTGHLLVRSRPATIEEIEEYIGILREKYRRQVLIEAKIIEVNLSEKHALGIDWRNVSAALSRAILRPVDAATAVISPIVGSDESFYSVTVNSEYSDITGIFHALGKYGELSLLSNPRLKAMNGQAAVISVGQSVSYLASFEQNSEGTGDNKTVEYSTEIGSVFDGILLGLTPVIENDGMVTLHIVPIKSDLVELDEMSFGPTFSTYQVTLPRVNLRELSTVTRLHSGDIVLLGGLIMDYDDSDENGIPYLQDIPLVGKAFQYKSKEKRHVELVVALQVRVVGYSPNQDR